MRIKQHPLGLTGIVAFGIYSSNYYWFVVLLVRSDLGLAIGFAYSCCYSWIISELVRSDLLLYYYLVV